VRSQTLERALDALQVLADGKRRTSRSGTRADLQGAPDCFRRLMGGWPRRALYFNSRKLEELQRDVVRILGLQDVSGTDVFLVAVSDAPLRQHRRSGTHPGNFQAPVEPVHLPLMADRYRSVRLNGAQWPERSELVAFATGFPCPRTPLIP
jgi:hypothetical protein